MGLGQRSNWENECGWPSLTVRGCKVERAQGAVTGRGPKDGECVAGEKPSALGFRMEE